MREERSGKPQQFVVIIVIWLLSIGCATAVTRDSNPAPMQPEVGNTPTKRSPPDLESFEDVDGVLVFREFSEEIKANEGLIKLYGNDGYVWKTIDYYEDYQMPAEYKDFKPLSFRQSDFDLKFRCTGISRSWFQVIVSEDPQITKYVATGDRLFKYLPWRDFILGFVSVQYESDDNPLRENPAGKPLSNVPKNVRFVPIEVRGEWLNVRANGLHSIASKNDRSGLSGWIRWREGNKILVSEFYP